MKIAKEVKVGGVAVLAIAFLIYGINYLKGIDLFKNGKEYYVVYDDLAGLVPASPVQYNGMRVGQVTETRLITYRDTMKMLVTFIIDNDNFKFPKQSYAKLFSADLFGTRAIQIIPGKGPLAEEGDTLYALMEQSLQSKVDAAIYPLVEKSQSLISKLEIMVEGLSDVVGENSDGLTQSIESFKMSLRNIKIFSDKLNALMDSETGKISGILTEVRSITGNLAKNSSSIDKAIDNIASITDSVAKSDISGTFTKLKGTVDNLNTMLDKVNKGEGTLGSLVNDDSLYVALVATNEELNRLLANIREHPNRYLHFSVFGRKEKGLKLDPKEEKKLKELLKD